MPAKLRVTILQQPVVWHNIQANISHFTNVVKSIKKGSTDVIVLPEMFTTGFTTDAPHLAELEGGPSMLWMAETAALKRSAVCGSLMIKRKNNIYNTFIWMYPDLSYTAYDKRHLFTMGNEHNIFTAGRESVLIEYNGWTICPQICYDLRFPVWSRNRLKKLNEKQVTPEYEILLYVANWPKVRRYAWNHLLIARAIENQCYVIGVNRTGKDGNGIIYSGDSVVIDPSGEKISFTTSKESVETIALDPKRLIELRESFPVLMDGDTFTIK
jgi:omega-amidase